MFEQSGPSGPPMMEDPYMGDEEQARRLAAAGLLGSSGMGGGFDPSMEQALMAQMGQGGGGGGDPMGMMGGSPTGEGGPGQGSGQPPVMDGKMRSALAFIDSAQELLQAAADNKPELAPIIEQATNMIAQGLESFMQGGPAPPQPMMGPQGMGAEMDPMASMMGMGGAGPQGESIAGGGIAGEGPENLTLNI